LELGIAKFRSAVSAGKGQLAGFTLPRGEQGASSATLPIGSH
jgi:hypothetical protein